MIKPLKNLVRDPGENELASTAWVHRLLKSTLEKLNISIEGGELTEEGVGHLHIKLNGGASLNDLPFRVSLNGDASGLRVAPGLVYSANYDSSTQGTPAHVPVIGGVALNAASPPTAPLGRYICLECRFNPDGWQIGAPWEIKTFNTLPADQAVIRSFTGTGTPREGKYYLMIAEYQGGKVTQWVFGNIMANLNWSDFQAFA